MGRPAPTPVRVAWRYTSRSPGAIAQLGERLAGSQKVAGSSPAGSIFGTLDGIRGSVIADRSKFFKDLSGPFYGADRPGANVSQGLRDGFWLQGMQAGFKGVIDCIKAFSETDFTEDLKKFDVPTLIVHGDDDQIVPIDAAGRAAARLVKGSKLIVYPGAPHGLTDTHKDKLSADLLAFVKSVGA